MPKSKGGLTSALVGQPILGLKEAQESLTLKETPDLSYMRSTPSPKSSMPEAEALSGKQLAPGQAFFNSDMVFWPKQRGCSCAWTPYLPPIQLPRRGSGASELPRGLHSAGSTWAMTSWDQMSAADVRCALLSTSEGLSNVGPNTVARL